MQSLACNSKWLASTLSSEGLITSLSSGAEQFTGYSAQELVGLPFSQILSDLSAIELPRILDSAREWGHWEGEIEHRTRGGRLLHARAIVSPLAGSGYSEAGYLMVSNLSRTLPPEECANAAVAEVAGNLRAFAHDLNNPLAVIMGFAQLLMLNPNCNGDIRGDVERLYSELKQVIQVVERLQRYAISLYQQLGADSPFQKPSTCTSTSTLNANINNHSIDELQ